jgi:hypothetical protein
LSVTFITLKALDPALVSQLKDFLSDPLFKRLNGSLSTDQEQLKFAEYKIRVLEESRSTGTAADLPRKEQIIPCTAEQCVCGKCRRETTVVGYEQSERAQTYPTSQTSSAPTSLPRPR